MSTLLLEFWTEKKNFCIYAEAGDYEKELTLKGQAEEITAHFNTIYDIIEDKKENKEAKLQETIKTLSDLLIAPFEKQLEACDLVRFIVDESVIRCAFDLLLHKGNYLFLQKSICYQMDEGQGEDEPKIKLKSALLVADLSADPEKACEQVSKLMPKSKYAEVKDANLEMIEEAASEVDALVISAHGELDDDNSGNISINDETLNSDIIEETEAWVVYFDSCQQGVNMDFLNAFQEESDTQYYLAPITSNDAGDSSTKTMVWFFKSILEHGNPIKALFDTRKQLFDFYATKQKLELVTTLNKAFPFRMYEFVDIEEEK